MADILEFRKRPDSPDRDRVPGTNAEIVIFPGVRIERTGFSLADRVPPKSRRGGTGRSGAVATVEE